MTAIAIYVEGGGDSTDQKGELRRGFDALFKAAKSRAREKRRSFQSGAALPPFRGIDTRA